MNAQLLLLAFFSAFAQAVALRPNSSDPAPFAVGHPVSLKAGVVQGSPSTLRQNVSAYLGIPFAEPPLGDRRFEPPVAITSFSSSPFDASDYGPDCPSNHIPTGEAFIGGPSGAKILTSVSQAGRPYSEDCLSINVWTKPQAGEKSKAVLFWIFGGGFSIGNTAAEVYDGSILADENDVIVVSANYRVNIFGFPGGPGLTQNVGLLDQRMALEWTRDNIAAFGGDPSRITVFGQSAGGSSTDWLSIVYPEDPIAHGFIPQSGVATGAVSAPIQSAETTLESWYTISQAVGCGDSDDGPATVSCIRSKTMDELLSAVSDNEYMAIMSGFGATFDDVTVPLDSAARITSGNFSKLPIMTGSTEDEAAFFGILVLAYTSLSASTVSDISPVFPLIQPLLDMGTWVLFTCGTAKAAELRFEQDVPVYRYKYYGGNYSNIYTKYVGSAYHTAELPMVFGTAAHLTGIPDEPAQAVMGRFMRESWAAFAKDPVNGLAELGWPKYNPETNSIVQLAVQGEATPSFTSSSEVDPLCSTFEEVVNLVSGGAVKAISSIFDAVRAVINNEPSANAVKTILSENPGPLSHTSVSNILLSLAKLNL